MWNSLRNWLIQTFQANKVRGWESLKRLPQDVNDVKQRKHHYNCPLQIGDAWETTRIKEMALIQEASLPSEMMSEEVSASAS